MTGPWEGLGVPGAGWPQVGLPLGRVRAVAALPEVLGGGSMTEGEAQAAVAEIALELVAITDRLQRIHDELPVSPDREAMLEHRVAYDIATELVGTIECVVADQLRPAMEYLEAASRVTAEELREQHREQQALLRRLRGRMRDEIG